MHRRQHWSAAFCLAAAERWRASEGCLPRCCEGRALRVARRGRAACNTRHSLGRSAGVSGSGRCGAALYVVARIEYESDALTN